MPTISRMMIVSFAGFAVSTAFVTSDGVELPYYIALIGACALKLEAAEASKRQIEDEYIQFHYPDAKLARI